MDQLQHNPDNTKHKTLVIRKTFDSSPSQVWNALTEEDALKSWWGPKGYTCPYYDLDLEKGGNYLACMRNRVDGSDSWSTGVFVEIVPEEKLVMTDHFSNPQGRPIPAPAFLPGDWSHNLIITYQLDETEGKTTLTLIHEGLPSEVHDDCLKGWNESLDKLEALLRGR